MLCSSSIQRDKPKTLTIHARVLKSSFHTSIDKKKRRDSNVRRWREPCETRGARPASRRSTRSKPSSCPTSSFTGSASSVAIACAPSKARTWSSARQTTRSRTASSATPRPSESQPSTSENLSRLLPSSRSWLKDCRPPTRPPVWVATNKVKITSNNHFRVRQLVHENRRCTLRIVPLIGLLYFSQS